MIPQCKKNKVKEKLIWEGNSLGGSVINLDVSAYKKIKVKVQLSMFITFLEIDLTIQTAGIEKNDVNYKYCNAIFCGALDGTDYINKCCVGVSANKTKIIGYDFGYASLASSAFTFNNRDNTSGWAILEIIGIK